MPVTFSDALATPPSAVGLPHPHWLWVPLNLPGRTCPCTAPAWRGPGEAHQGLRVLGVAQGVRAGRRQPLVTVVTVLEPLRVRPSEFTFPLNTALVHSPRAAASDLQTACESRAER